MGFNDTRDKKLAFTSFNFVTTKVFLGFGVGRVLTSDWVVFTQRQPTLALSGAVLCIDCRVVSSVLAFVAHQSDQLAFRILLCHSFPLTICT